MISYILQHTNTVPSGRAGSYRIFYFKTKNTFEQNLCAGVYGDGELFRSGHEFVTAWCVSLRAHGEQKHRTSIKWSKMVRSSQCCFDLQWGEVNFNDFKWFLSSSSWFHFRAKHAKPNNLTLKKGCQLVNSSRRKLERLHVWWEISTERPSHGAFGLGESRVQHVSFWDTPPKINGWIP